MMKNNRVDFDEYADQYEELLQEQLAFFSKDRGYFSEYKVALAAKHSPRPPVRVLDFGCGIGLSLPFLMRYFPGANIFATDLSEGSLGHVRKNFRDVTVLSDGEVEEHSYDMIFVTGVFHHVPIQQRESLIKRLAKLLSMEGRLVVFEHNPFNPVTRHMVATCPFDADAELIRLGSMKRLVASSGINVTSAGYCLFFPQLLSILRPLEKYLCWLPGGGQYFVVAKK